MKRTILAILAAATMVFSAGCSWDDVMNAISADGRDYGDTVAASNASDWLETSFFDFKVNGAYTFTGVIGDYDVAADSGYKILAVDVTVVNTFGDEIPVGSYDFNIVFGDGEDDWDYALMEDNLSDEQYPADTYIADGETAEGYVYFIVPEGATEFKFEYLEVWDDNFEGNNFSVPISNPEQR